MVISPAAALQEDHFEWSTMRPKDPSIKRLLDQIRKGNLQSFKNLCAPVFRVEQYIRPYADLGFKENDYFSFGLMGRDEDRDHYVLGVLKVKKTDERLLEAVRRRLLALISEAYSIEGGKSAMVSETPVAPFYGISGTSASNVHWGIEVGRSGARRFIKALYYGGH